MAEAEERTEAVPGYLTLKPVKGWASVAAIVGLSRNAFLLHAETSNVISDPALDHHRARPSLLAS